MSRYLRGTGLFAIFALIVTPAWSGSHLWEINELYSSSDGTIQYIELYNSTAANEINMAAKWIKSNLNQSTNFGFTLPPNSTADKYLLLATTGYANLHPDAPQPDFIINIPADFFETSGDDIDYWFYPNNPWTMLSFGPGDMPTDDLHSMNRHWPATSLISECMTPTNFAGDRFPPTDASGLLVDKLTPNGSRLSLSWNDCLGSGDHHIVHGVPSGLGATITPSGSKCDIRCSPYNWVSNVPNPASGEWLWFLVLSNDDSATEGSWGTDNNGIERIGPGPGGSSGMCSISAKNASSTCGP